MLLYKYFKRIVLASFLLSGCKGEHTKNNIDYNLRSKKILLIDSEYKLIKSSHDIYENAQIIPLKFKDINLISGIDKILIKNKFFYLFDHKFTTLYKFDSNGIFQNKIGKLGVKNVEYQSLEDFTIDSLNRIILLSNANQSISYYSSDNQFIKSQKLAFFNSQITLVNTNSFLFYLDYRWNKKSGFYNLIMTDSLGTINEQYSYFNKKISNMGFAFCGFIASHENEHFYSDAFNDTIFSIDSANRIGAKYIIDFGKYSLREIREYHSKVANPANLMNNNFGYIGNKVCFNRQFLIFTYFYQKRLNYCVYNRETNAIYRINKAINDGLLKLLDYPLLITEGNKCYFAVSPDAVLRLKEKHKDLYKNLKEEWPKLYQFLERISIDDNYFLLSVDLKK